MKGEINRDYYCTRFDIAISEGRKEPEKCHICKKVCELGLVGKPHKEAILVLPEYEYCKHRRHKHPTPKQFKKEYGQEWDGLIYLRTDYPIEKIKGKKGGWKYDEFKKGTLYDETRVDIVCACTPFGKPKDDWSPE